MRTTPSDLPCTGSKCLDSSCGSSSLAMAQPHRHVSLRSLNPPLGTKHKIYIKLILYSKIFKQLIRLQFYKNKFPTLLTSRAFVEAINMSFTRRPPKNLTSGFCDNKVNMSASKSCVRSYLIPKTLVVVARMKTVRRALKHATFMALGDCFSTFDFNASTLSSTGSLYHLSWRRWSAPSEKLFFICYLHPKILYGLFFLFITTHYLCNFESFPLFPSSS